MRFTSEDMSYIKSEELLIISDMVYREIVGNPYRSVDISLVEYHIIMVTIVNGDILLVAENRDKMLRLTDLSLQDLERFRREFRIYTRELREFTDKVIGFAGTEREIAIKINDLHPMKRPLESRDVRAEEWFTDRNGRTFYRLYLFLQDIYDILYGNGETFFVATKTQNGAYCICNFDGIYMY